MTNEGTTGNEATMWTDEAMHAAYKEAFDKDPDAHHWALLSWIRDDMQQALAAEHAAALERVKELEEMLSVERQAYSDSATRQRDFYIAALVKRDIHIRELKAQLAERSEYEWTPVAGSLEWGTIEVALKNERAALCGCDACKLGRDSIDAALAFVREQRVPTAPQVAPTPQEGGEEASVSTVGEAAQKVASRLAIAMLEDNLKKGRSIHIPSLGITIEGESQPGDTQP